jgi:hypothetical protein
MPSILKEIRRHCITAKRNRSCICCSFNKYANCIFTTTSPDKWDLKEIENELKIKVHKSKTEKHEVNRNRTTKLKFMNRN